MEKNRKELLIELLEELHSTECKWSVCEYHKCGYGVSGCYGSECSIINVLSEVRYSLMEDKNA